MTRSGDPPIVIAVMMVRNAAATVGRLFDHMETQGIPVVVIDHGSVDATREIVEARQGRGISEIIDEPFRGVFDLTRQLDLKREVIGGLESEWIVHLDADEFLFSRDPGDTLVTFLRRPGMDASEAIDCDEIVYFPATEEERHTSESFLETMTTSLRYLNRDRKQRIFRRSAALDEWMRTGGHFVSWESAPESVVLRHYIGLSLDHLRAQYLGRVYAAGDIAKKWHFNRRARAADFVRAPPSQCLAASLKPEAPRSRAVWELPVFSRASLAPPARSAIPPDTELLLACDLPSALIWTRAAIAQAFPKLRVVALHQPVDQLPAEVPLLHVIADGRHWLAPERPGAARRLAAEWCRFVASVRQEGMRGMRYAETRVEDLRDGRTDLRGLMHGLLGGTFTPHKSFGPHAPWRDPPDGLNAEELAAFETLAGVLLRDLGYAPPSADHILYPQPS